MTLLAFVACLFPIALPRFQAKKSSNPFPCQDCACGCQTPEQCWTSCCCLTPIQRAQWARQKGVTPPSYAILNDTNVMTDDSEIKTRSCCAPPDAPACSISTDGVCQTKSSGTCKHCVPPKNKSNVKNTVADTHQEASNNSGYFLVMLAFKCKGITFGYSVLPVFELNPPIALPTTYSRFESPQLANAVAVRAYHPVPIPPPKL